MKITQKALKEIKDFAQHSAGDYLKKQSYNLRGRNFLKQLVKDLGLTPSSYSIRFNPGGPAVSGDLTLHHERFYLHLSDNCNFGSFYYRSCKGLKDYCGGPNINVNWDKWISNGYSAFVEELKNRFLKVDECN